MRDFEHFDRHSLINMVKDALGLDDKFDQIPAHRTSRRKRPFEYYCLTSVKPTNYIMNFEYVTDECANIFCANPHPCAECVSLIDRLKFYMRAIKIIDHDPVNGPGRHDRVREYIDMRNKKIERQRRGWARRERIKEKWRNK